MRYLPRRTSLKYTHSRQQYFFPVFFFKPIFSDDLNDFVGVQYLHCVPLMNRNVYGLCKLPRIEGDLMTMCLVHVVGGAWCPGNRWDVIRTVRPIALVLRRASVLSACDPGTRRTHHFQVFRLRPFALSRPYTWCPPLSRHSKTRIFTKAIGCQPTTRNVLNVFVAAANNFVVNNA